MAYQPNKAKRTWRYMCSPAYAYRRIVEQHRSIHPYKILQACMAGLSMEQIVFTRKEGAESWMQKVASLDACMWWIATSSTLVRLLVKELPSHPSACIRSTALFTCNNSDEQPRRHLRSALQRRQLAAAQYCAVPPSC